MAGGHGFEDLKSFYIARRGHKTSPGSSCKHTLFFVTYVLRKTIYSNLENLP